MFSIPLWHMAGWIYCTIKTKILITPNTNNESKALKASKVCWMFCIPEVLLCKIKLHFSHGIMWCFFKRFTLASEIFSERKYDLKSSNFCISTYFSRHSHLVLAFLLISSYSSPQNTYYFKIDFLLLDLWNQWYRSI